MCLTKFEDRFKNIQKFNLEKKLPGFSQGLEILKVLNEESFSSVDDLESNIHFTSYYNFDKKILIKIPTKTLNAKLSILYDNIIINNIILSGNKLYFIFYNVLEKLIIKNNYKFNNNFSIKNILFKIFHGLRKNQNFFSKKFLVNKIVLVFDDLYLDIKSDAFYLLILEFFLDLWQENVLVYDKADNSIVFDYSFDKDLYSLINASFDPIFLGENANFEIFDLKNFRVEEYLNYICDNSHLFDDNKNFLVNDLLRNFVICCAVEVISSKININNIFIDNLKYVATKQ